MSDRSTYLRFKSLTRGRGKAPGGPRMSESDAVDGSSDRHLGATMVAVEGTIQKRSRP